MKRALMILAALLFAGAAYAAEQVVYRPKATFTVDANPHTSTAATSAPSAHISVVRIIAAKDVYLSVGVSPFASAGVTGMYLPAFTPEYFQIGEGQQIAVLSVSSTGTVYITEMTQ